MITFKHRGNFNNTERFLTRAQSFKIAPILNNFGQKGVRALAAATPVDSGETAASWDYEIKITGRGCTLTWTNSNIVDGVPIAIILQYGHGTGNGGYVQGRNYINPAINPVFDEIESSIREELSRL